MQLSYDFIIGRRNVLDFVKKFQNNICFYWNRNFIWLILNKNVQVILSIIEKTQF